MHYLGRPVAKRISLLFYLSLAQIAQGLHFKCKFPDHCYSKYVYVAGNFTGWLTLTGVVVDIHTIKGQTITPALIAEPETSREWRSYLLIDGAGIGKASE